MSKPEEVQERIEQLEAERLILTIEVRNELLRAAKKLMPKAMAQAQDKRNPSPALLRLITRLAMRPFQMERPRKKPAE
jgi:hypothetical protein